MKTVEGVLIEGTRLVTKTEGALCVAIEGIFGRHWIPESQVIETDLESAGDEGTLVITEWIAERKPELFSSARPERSVVRVPDCLCKRETDKALLVILPDLEEAWVPKSQIDEKSEVQGDDDAGALIISEWLAEQKPELMDQGESIVVQ